MLKLQRVLVLLKALLVHVGSRNQDSNEFFFQVDILVNNGARSQRSLINKTSLEVHRALLDLNVVGTISLTKAVLPHMIERHKGQIVVVSSVLGKLGNIVNLLALLIDY